MKSPVHQSKVDETPALTAPDYFRLGEVERVSALRPSSLKTGGQFLLSGRSPGERLDKRNSRE